MGCVKDMLIDKVEEVLKRLGFDTSEDCFSERALQDDNLFDNIEEFIMDNGSMVYDSPLEIANAYKKSVKGKDAKEIKLSEAYLTMLRGN